MSMGAHIFRFFKAVPLCACAAWACINASGCSKHQTPAEIAAAKKILLIGNAADPEGLDPALTTGLAEFKILSALFEGLVTADSDTLEIKPAAAKSWKIEEGGTLYTFKLDPKSKWSNGDKVTAQDFVFAWRRALNPAIAAEYATMLYPVKNAQPIHQGKADPSTLGAKALDDETLQVKLERPTSYFLSLLYHNVYFPLHKPTLEKFNAANSRNAEWTRAKNIVSNGAFTLEKWNINDKVSLKKNQNFRAAEKIKLNGIKFFPISNINTEDRAFRAGQLHITESIAPMRLKSIKRDMPQCLKNSPMFGTYYYVFNTRRAPLDNALVRRALSMAIDRNAIIENFLRGGQAAAYSFIPKNCGKYSSKKAEIKEDVEEAKKLLAQAGYPDGKDFPVLKLTYNTSEQHKPIAEAIQQMWKENLGIDVELYNLSWPAYLDARKRRDFDIARASWVADFDAPENFLENFSSDCGLNHSGFSDKQFDKHLRAAKTQESQSGNIKEIEAAEMRLMKESPLMPIYFYSRINLVSPKVSNWYTNPLDYHNWQEVDLKATNKEGETK